MNALFFQEGRHPAPIFLTKALQPPLPSTPSSARTTAQRVTSTFTTPDESTKPKTEVARAAPKSESVRNDLPASVKISTRPNGKPAETTKHDPIAELLKAAPKPKIPTQSDVAMAQQALLKLGYVVRVDGNFSKSTQLAIEKFEHDNGLPPKGALTTKIAALLASRAGLESE